jgi:hypothetical protein
LWLCVPLYADNSVWNRKSGKLVAMSDQMDDEFLSIQVMKRGRKGVSVAPPCVPSAVAAAGAPVREA